MSSTLLVEIWKKPCQISYCIFCFEDSQKLWKWIFEWTQHFRGRVRIRDSEDRLYFIDIIFVKLSTWDLAKAQSSTVRFKKIYPEINITRKGHSMQARPQIYLPKKSTLESGTNSGNWKPFRLASIWWGALVVNRLKGLLVLEMRTFLSWLFDYVEKWLDKKTIVNYKIPISEEVKAIRQWNFVS